jgi:hypothetical protein
VNSSEGEKCGKSLKERGKERLAHRKVPLSENFDDYGSDKKSKCEKGNVLVKLQTQVKAWS